jgi:hypothetical protein
MGRRGGGGDRKMNLKRIGGVDWNGKERWEWEREKGAGEIRTGVKKGGEGEM